jgi:hypothetical protein
MSTELRNVPDCEAQNELTQTRFWGGKDRMQCLQVTQTKHKSERTAGAGVADFFNHLSLTKHQARMLAVELMLFAEGREVEEFEDCGGDDHHAVEVNADTMAHLANSN